MVIHQVFTDKDYPALNIFENRLRYNFSTKIKKNWYHTCQLFHLKVHVLHFVMLKLLICLLQQSYNNLHLKGKNQKS